MRILLDNGHGLNTPGKRSPVWPDGSQLMEWRWCRELVKRIEEALRALSLTVRRLVPEYTDIPVWERVLRVNRHCKEVGAVNCLLVSVHVNASSNGQARGWEVHTSLGQTLSDYYATLFYREASRQLVGLDGASAGGSGVRMRGDHSDGDPDWDSNFALLRDTLCPAVLTENLFMDNAADCRLLMSEAGKERLTALHVNAIGQVLNQRNN